MFQVLFLMYVTLGESYGLTLFIGRAIFCNMYPHECGEDKTQFRVVVCVLVGFISALFLAFVWCVPMHHHNLMLRGDL